MLTSNFTGNLGNHMWIYAITRAVASHKGYEWGFNSTPEYDYYDGRPQMDFMDIDYGIKHNFKYKDSPDWMRYVWVERHEHTDYPNGDSVDYHPYQPDIFGIEDNTKLFIRCCQDARYLQKFKDIVKEWFHIRDDFSEIYRNQLLDNDVYLDDDIVVINVRGGEYRGISNLILDRDYYNDAFTIIKKRNPKAHFVCVTDDTQYANSLFYGAFPIVHLSIGGDYYIINNAKNLILSNSSFAIFPAWLNENNPYVIAPRYWARHNISTGYWASSDIWTFGWNFLDKDGQLYEK
jgi:hypothetical protein